jgi:hypothetical protein
MRLSRISLLLVLILLAALIPALPAAANPPFTEFSFWPNGPSVNTEYGSERLTGAAFHSWDWVYVNPIASTDPRVTGDLIVGPGTRCNLVWQGPATSAFACHGKWMIAPADQSLGGYWEGSVTLTPHRPTNYVGHGRGAFEGLQIQFDIFEDLSIATGRIIEH